MIFLSLNPANVQSNRASGNLHLSVYFFYAYNLCYFFFFLSLETYIPNIFFCTLKTKEPCFQFCRVNVISADYENKVKVKSTLGLYCAAQFKRFSLFMMIWKMHCSWYRKIIIRYLIYRGKVRQISMAWTNDFMHAIGENCSPFWTILLCWFAAREKVYSTKSERKKMFDVVSIKGK